VRFPILCSDYENQATMLIVLDCISNSFWVM